MTMRIGDIILIPYLHDEGMMRIEMGRGRHESQVFSYQFLNDRNEPKGDTLHVHVAKLIRQIAQNPDQYIRLLVNVNKEHAEFIMRHNGIEMDYLDKIPTRRLHSPGILLRWKDDKETMVDGNHRYVKLWKMGRTEMKFWVVTEEQIKPCLLKLPNGFGIDNEVIANLPVTPTGK